MTMDCEEVLANEFHVGICRDLKGVSSASSIETWHERYLGLKGFLSYEGPGEARRRGALSRRFT